MNTLFDAVPHTARKRVRLGTLTGDHRPPSKRSTTPESPTTYTFVGSLPHTARKNCCVPLDCGVQASPLERRIVPRSPAITY